MRERNVVELLLNDKLFLLACALIVICFCITQFFGRFKIIGILSFLSVVLLIIDLYKSKLYTHPFAIVIVLMSFFTGIAIFLYAFIYNLR